MSELKLDLRTRIRNNNKKQKVKTFEQPEEEKVVIKTVTSSNVISFDAMYEILVSMLSKEYDTLKYVTASLGFINASRDNIDLIALDTEINIKNAKRAVAALVPMNYYYSNAVVKSVTPDDLESLLTEKEYFDYSLGYGPKLPLYTMDVLKEKREQRKMTAIVPDDMLTILKAELLTRAFTASKQSIYDIVSRTKAHEYLPPGVYDVYNEYLDDENLSLEQFRKKMYQVFYAFNYGSYDPYELVDFLRQRVSKLAYTDTTGIRKCFSKFFEKLVPTPFFPQTSQVISEVSSLLGIEVHATNLELDAERLKISRMTTVEEIVEEFAQYENSEENPPTPVLISKSSINSAVTYTGADTSGQGLFYLLVELLQMNLDVWVIDAPAAYRPISTGIFVKGSQVLDYSNMTCVFNLTLDQDPNNYQFMSYDHHLHLTEESFDYQEGVLGFLFSDPAVMQASYDALISEALCVKILSSRRRKTDKVEEEVFEPKYRVPEGDQEVEEEIALVTKGAVSSQQESPGMDPGLSEALLAEDNC